MDDVIVKVVYPLIDKKSGKESGYYTMTAYDNYQLNKVKYIRGNSMIFASDLRNRPSNVQLLSRRPKTIEESADYDKWKCSYSILRGTTSSVDYVAAYASFKMLTGK